MAEVDEESTHIWSSKQRIAIFISAMRHFADEVRGRGLPLHYVQFNDPKNSQHLSSLLQTFLTERRPVRVVMTAPGDWRVWQSIRSVAQAASIELEIRDDRHFYSTVRDFVAHAKGRSEVRLEFFYRELRRRHEVLMRSGKPEGGRWNFDSSNRHAFGAKGPGLVPSRATFPPDATTREVIDLVNHRFASHPGELASFAWPINRAQALESLHSFVEQRLPQFGRYQDAMWPGEPWLFHAHLSAALNLKLLEPREVVGAAERAYREGRAPLESVEGFIRQILGWREYVRGVYWSQMPGYLERNFLEADQNLPAWYWDGNTDFQCLSETIKQTLREGYAHHIQRLMVAGLFALLLGVKPKQVHEWYLAVYVDAIEWVELPNTLGMSQYGDGGLMASKPYAATGKYIQRMGGPCSKCRYDPAIRVGENACPFTTLYWDFLLRHETLLSKNRRMVFQIKSLEKLDSQERSAVAERASSIRRGQVGRLATDARPTGRVSGKLP